jgi:hypothetical protein
VRHDAHALGFAWPSVASVLVHILQQRWCSVSLTAAVTLTTLRRTRSACKFSSHFPFQFRRAYAVIACAPLVARTLFTTLPSLLRVSSAATVVARSTAYVLFAFVSFAYRYCLDPPPASEEVHGSVQASEVRQPRLWWSQLLYLRPRPVGSPTFLFRVLCLWRSVIRAFLIEEQKIVKKLLKAQAAKK